jgi:hypothetical protein
MTIFRKHTFIRISDNMFTGSTWSKPWQARIVLLTMLWLGQSSNGYVAVTISGLARFCGISIEDTMTGLNILLAEDPDSRSASHGGRTIEAVEGGFQIINFQSYQELMNGEKKNGAGTDTGTGTVDAQSPAGTNKKTSSSSTKANEKEKEKDSSQETSAPMKTLQGTSVRTSVGTSAMTSAVTETWSPEERGAYKTLNTQLKRDIFFNVRARIAQAAKEGKATAHLPQDVMAVEHGCTQENVSLVLREFQREGYLIRRAKSKPLEGKAAEYQWNLPTTLSIPAYTPPLEDDEDLPL